jgi:hypothetical protein
MEYVRLLLTLESTRRSNIHLFHGFGQYSRQITIDSTLVIDKTVQGWGWGSDAVCQTHGIDVVP